MKIIIIIILVCIFSKTYSQVNLVKNPSFENYSLCPNSTDEVSYANNWSGIDTSSTALGTASCLPEYVNTCGTGSGHVPNSGWFNHYCRTGNGMIGMMMYYDYGFSSHIIDYLQGRLYHPLIVGQSYCVTFYVVLGQHTGYAVNHFGAYLDNGSIDSTGLRCSYYQTEYHPQIVDTPVVFDTTNWTKVQGSFIANGTETFITIGNFFDTGGTTHIPYIHPGYNIAYYILDDVSVIATGTPAYAGRDTTIHAGDSTYIGIDSNGEGMPCLWYILGEPTPIDSGGRILVHPAGTTTYIVAMDLCGTITYDTVVVTVADVGINKLNEQFLHIYPNPAKDNFTIEGAMGCEVRIYNMVGQSFDKLRMTNDKLRMTSNKEIIDIIGLSKGLYIVEILEPETGMRVSRRVVKE